MKTQDDWDLLFAARQGGRSEWALLYHRHRDRLYRLAYSVLRDHSRAEDLMQDCLLKMVSSDPPKELGNFSGYTGTIVWRMALRERGHVIRDNIPVNEDALAAGTGSPETELLADERRNGAMEALDKLPEAQRQVLCLRLIGSLSYLEIAEVLQIPLGTVRSRLHSGIEKCRKQLHEF